MQCVTASYFDVLGVRMQIGRPFTAAEDTPPSPFLGAVISDRLWQSMFQRSPDVLEQTLDIAGVTFAILGVAPPRVPRHRAAVDDRCLAARFEPADHPPHAGAALRRRATARGFYELVARLKPGATWAAAQAEMEALRAWLREQYPKDNDKFRTDGLPGHGSDRTASARPHDDAAGRRLDRVRRERAGAADRLRQRRRPADDQGTRPPSRDRGPQSARRRTRAAAPAAPRRRTAAVGRRRRRRARTAAAPAPDARRRRA